MLTRNLHQRDDHVWLEWLLELPNSRKCEAHASPHDPLVIASRLQRQQKLRGSASDRAPPDRLSALNLATSATSIAFVRSTDGIMPYA